MFYLDKVFDFVWSSPSRLEMYILYFFLLINIMISV